MIDTKIKEIKDLFVGLHFTYFKAAFHKLNKIGIHPGQILILKLIYDNEGVSQKELVEFTRRERATITKAVQRLENAGFIIRCNNEKDKRSSVLYLTDKGKEIYKLVKEHEVEELELMQKILSEADLDKIIEILTKLETGLKENTDEKNI